MCVILAERVLKVYDALCGGQAPNTGAQEVQHTLCWFEGVLGDRTPLNGNKRARNIYMIARQTKDSVLKCFGPGPLFTDLSTKAPPEVAGTLVEHAVPVCLVPSRVAAERLLEIAGRALALFTRQGGKEASIDRESWQTRF